MTMLNMRSGFRVSRKCSSAAVVRLSQAKQDLTLRTEPERNLILRLRSPITGSWIRVSRALQT